MDIFGESLSTMYTAVGRFNSVYYLLCTECTQDRPFETHRPRITASLHLQAAGIETAWPSRIISLSSSYLSVCSRLIIGSGHMRALART